MTNSNIKIIIRQGLQQRNLILNVEEEETNKYIIIEVKEINDVDAPVLFYLGVVKFNFQGTHIVSFLYHINLRTIKDLLKYYPIIYEYLQLTKIQNYNNNDLITYLKKTRQDKFLYSQTNNTHNSTRRTTQ